MKSGERKKRLDRDPARGPRNRHIARASGLLPNCLCTEPMATTSTEPGKISSDTSEKHPCTIGNPSSSGLIRVKKNLRLASAGSGRTSPAPSHQDQSRRIKANQAENFFYWLDRRKRRRIAFAHEIFLNTFASRFKNEQTKFQRRNPLHTVRRDYDHAR